MFGFGKKIRERQLRRAVLVQNFAMMSLFSRLRSLFKIEGEASAQGQAIAAAINEQFAKRADKDHFTKEQRSLLAQASDASQADPILQQLTIRVLFDIFSLASTLKAAALLAEYPSIVTVLERGKAEYPALFQDWKEVQFKSLVGQFADYYVPEKKAELLRLF